MPTKYTIARLIEDSCVKYKMHVALTGGCLYKLGPRKDIDFILYHERGEEDPQTMKDNVIDDLNKEGFSNWSDTGFVTKCTYEGLAIDLLYPEYEGDGDYPEEDPISEPVEPIGITPFIIPGVL